MFYKFKDCVILETVISKEENSQDLTQYRVLNIKSVTSKENNKVLHDELVSFFDDEKEGLTVARIKDKNPGLTDKACQHIFDLFMNNPEFQVLEED